MRLIRLSMGRVIDVDAIESIVANRLSADEEISRQTQGRTLKRVHTQNDNGYVTFACATFTLRTRTGKEWVIGLADEELIAKTLTRFKRWPVEPKPPKPETQQ